MKRVLIITYYWPPAGGPGVQRWLKFVKYFREFEIEPIVYVPLNAHYPLQDASFVTEVPKDVEILKQRIKEPYRFAKLLSKKKTQAMSSGLISKKEPSLLNKLMLYIRGNYFIPDARIGWVKPSVRYISDYLQSNQIDAIVTTGPPHSLHLIGLELKNRFGINWLADFRDPWTTIHYHDSLRLTEKSKRKHKALEAKVLQAADAISVTSVATKSEFELITQQKIAVITNGFDVSDGVEAHLDTKFSLVHTGSLLSERNPMVLWRVLSELCIERNDFAKAFKLRLVGAVSEEVIASIEANGLTPYLDLPGYVTHGEAIQQQHNAQVLMLIEIDRPETKAIIPGKLFEYMLAQRPILALGPMGSDVSEMITNSNTGAYFVYTEKDNLKQHILDLFQLYSNGNLNSIPVSDISQYSRRQLTGTMASLLKTL